MVGERGRELTWRVVRSMFVDTVGEMEEGERGGKGPRHGRR